VKKIKFVILTFILAFSFSIQSNSKTVPASFADLAERLMPSVVNISTTQTVTTTTNPFPFQFPPGSPLKICLKSLELLKKGSLQHLDLVS
jgi:serine protease Do